ncbi:MAG: ATP-binding protein [Acidobacteriota bacterium]
MNLYSLLSFFAFIVYIYLAVYAVRLDRKSRLNLTFFLICAGNAVYSLCFTFLYPATDKETVWLWYKISSIGWASISAFALHFAIELTNHGKWFRRWWSYLLLYLPPIVSVYITFTSHLIVQDFVRISNTWFEVTANHSPWLIPFTIYYGGYLVFAIALVWQWGRRSTVPREKIQARVVVISGILTSLGVFITNSLLPSMEIRVVPALGSVIALFWAFGTWFAMGRYRLMTLTPAIAAREIINNIMDLVLLVNRDGHIIEMNRRILELLGYDEADLMEGTLETVVIEYDIIKDITDKMMNGVNTRLTTELNYKGKNGQAIPVKINCNSIKDKNDDILGIVIVAQDMRQTRQLQREIIERRAAEATLRKSNEKLQEMDRVKTEFLTMVSHELRTPLTSILGFTKVIKRKLDSSVLPAVQGDNKKAQDSFAQVQGNIDIILSEGDRLTSLINDVLDLAKMEAGKTNLDKKPIAVSTIIEHAINSTMALYQEKSIFLIKDVKVENLVAVVDRDRIIQVIVNLLSNAVKFTEMGHVVCRVQEVSEGVLISVIDTGVGIDAQEQEYVFDKFRQVGGDTLTDKPKGTGLGLAICKQIIEMHGGRIWVESQLGRGSNFSFILPLDDER